MNRLNTAAFLFVLLISCSQYQAGRATEFTPSSICAQLQQKVEQMNRELNDASQRCFNLRERTACIEYNSLRNALPKAQQEAQLECAKTGTTPPVSTPQPTPPAITPQPAPPVQLPPAQSEILFEEDFESTLSGWEGHLDAFTITDKFSKTGTHSIINQDQYDKWLVRTIGDYSEMTYSCWFYDTLGSVSETLCSVSRDRVNSQDMLLIGIETQKSAEKYSYFLSPDVNSWAATSIQRSLGWHNAKFVKKDGITELYLDGIKIGSTNRINDWRKIGINLNNWYSSPGHAPAIFDSLKVYKTARVCDTQTNQSGTGCSQEQTKRLATCIKSCVAESEKQLLI